MGDMLFRVERTVSRSREQILATLGAWQPANWLFGITCDRPKTGGVLRFTLPTPGGVLVQASGRFAQVALPHRFVIEQETPWRATLAVTLTPSGSQTRVHLQVRLGEDCLPWFIPANHPSDPGSSSSWRIGLLVSLAGPAGLLGRAAIDAAELAIDEVNQTGGIRGRDLTLAIGDDQSDPQLAAQEFTRLHDRLHVRAAIAMVPSASFRAIAPIAGANGALLIHSPLSEGGCSGATVFQVGERPRDQLVHAIPALMRHTDASGWFIIGNDYSWPRSVGEVARHVVEKNHSSILGERYLPLGTQAFTKTIEQIRRSGAELVLSALVGYDSAYFEQQMHAAGMGTCTRTLATLLDETIREHIGDDASEGMWSTLDGLNDRQESGQDTVQQAWLRRFGTNVPPLSGTARSVYDAIILYAHAAHLTKEADGRAVAAMLRSGRLGASRMLDRAAGLRRPTPIAQVVTGGFRIVDPAA